MGLASAAVHCYGLVGHPDLIQILVLLPGNGVTSQNSLNLSRPPFSQVDTGEIFSSH